MLNRKYGLGLEFAAEEIQGIYEEHYEFKPQDLKLNTVIPVEPEKLQKPIIDFPSDAIHYSFNPETHGRCATQHQRLSATDLMTSNTEYESKINSNFKSSKRRQAKNDDDLGK